MFISCTLYWCVMILDLIREIEVWIIDSRPNDNFASIYPLFNALSSTNVIPASIKCFLC